MEGKQIRLNDSDDFDDARQRTRIQHYWYYYKPSIWGEHLVGPVEELAFLNTVYWTWLRPNSIVCSPSRTGNRWQNASNVPIVAATIARRMSAQRQSRKLLKSPWENSKAKCCFRLAMWCPCLLIFCIPLVVVLVLAFGFLVAGLVEWGRDYKQKQKACFCAASPRNIPIIRRRRKPLMVVSVKKSIASSICGVCGEAVADRLVICKACKTPHHRECWEYIGSCSVYACGEEEFLNSMSIPKLHIR